MLQRRNKHLTALKHTVGLLVIPSRLIARNLLYTDFIRHTEIKGIQWIVVSSDPEDAVQISANESREWQQYFHPIRANPGRTSIGVFFDRVRYLFGIAIHMHLVHRFNILSGFQGFRSKLKQSWGLRKQYLREGQPMSKFFGFPFPKSRAIYNFLYRVYYSNWQTYQAVNKVFDNNAIEFVAIAQLQTHVITPYVLEANRRQIPILGINGSWDQPTTKGPLFPGLKFIFTQNEYVREDLIHFHNMRPENTQAVGWPQMDVYPKALDQVSPRASFLKEMGINQTDKVILFALNTPRLGGHELAVARSLYQKILAGEFGSGVSLLLRCHPLDTEWRLRWKEFLSRPRVVVDFPDWQSFEHIVTSIVHSEVVISSAGSFYLDALAMNQGAIGLAWEDESLPYYDRPARSYEMEHLQSMRDLGGVLVSNHSELEAAIKYALTNKFIEENSDPTRKKFFHALDGKSAKRLAEELADQVCKLLSLKGI